MKKSVLISTNNPGKVREILSILRSKNTKDYDFTIPSDLGIEELPVEDGIDYESNAVIKAKFYAEKTGLISLADDSGLEVFCLGGYPGIKSARAKSPINSDRSRYEALLEIMKEQDCNDRKARFVCVAVAFIPKTQKLISVRGEWLGEILETPRGDGGFGYDPIFFIPELGKTAAELTIEEKNAVSHRGKAFRELWDKLLEEMSDSL